MHHAKFSSLRIYFELILTLRRQVNQILTLKIKHFLLTVPGAGETARLAKGWVRLR